MSKKMMIFYSFPFNFSLKILNDLNDRDLNDRISLFSLSHAARYSERSSDSGQYADSYLKNCFPSVRFHFFEC